MKYLYGLLLFSILIAITSGCSNNNRDPAISLSFEPVEKFSATELQNYGTEACAGAVWIKTDRNTVFYREGSAKKVQKSQPGKKNQEKFAYLYSPEARSQSYHLQVSSTKSFEKFTEVTIPSARVLVKRSSLAAQFKKAAQDNLRGDLYPYAWQFWQEDPDVLDPADADKAWSWARYDKTDDGANKNWQLIPSPNRKTENINSLYLRIVSDDPKDCIGDLSAFVAMFHGDGTVVQEALDKSARKGNLYTKDGWNHPATRIVVKSNGIIYSMEFWDEGDTPGYYWFGVEMYPAGKQEKTQYTADLDGTEVRKYLTKLQNAHGLESSDDEYDDSDTEDSDSEDEAEDDELQDADTGQTESQQSESQKSDESSQPDSSSDNGQSSNTSEDSQRITNLLTERIYGKWNLNEGGFTLYIKKDNSFAIVQTVSATLKSGFTVQVDPTLGRVSLQPTDTNIQGMALYPISADVMNMGGSTSSRQLRRDNSWNPDSDPLPN
ncbi:hypothetical protein L248_1582 [Schleiferilactobacillus shenzhenensis LY-73]|uniref:Lipoprotein n=1 Tax=Schleiferilactobacillus shenzhenensis LY-73 TaxID=1231336 RepID=U4TL66_9LACO|nr:hypothetical protein L248_1582 [Schleiferilactobacillus shenzhenensis LY-73]